MDPTEVARLVAELKLATPDERPVVRISKADDRSDQRRLANIVVGKVFDARVVNRETLRSNIPHILQVRREVGVEIVGDNIFAINFGSDEDRSRALNDGPWHFFQSFMVFKETSGMQHPTEVKFEEVSIWIQLHNLPLRCMISEVVRCIGEKIGRVVEVETNEEGSCLGQFARVCVTRPIDQLLQRCVTVAMEGEVEERLVLTRYERLPDFCSACRRVGHVNCHSRDATVTKENCKFRQWLRASKVMEARRQRSPQSGRCMGYGRGMSSGTSGGRYSVTKMDKVARDVVGKKNEMLKTRREVGVMMLDGGGVRWRKEGCSRLPRRPPTVLLRKMD